MPFVLFQCFPTAAVFHVANAFFGSESEAPSVAADGVSIFNQSPNGDDNFEDLV